MATGTPDHGEVEPVTDHVHENSWSANLEQPVHAEDRELVVTQAKEAVAKTASGNHVNLVTHENHGHPEGFLYEALEAAFDDVEPTFVDQCGCGGYVSRVQVR